LKNVQRDLLSYQRKPEWLKIGLPGGGNYTRLKESVKRYGLNTVCESASCPNIGECWNMGTLTLMILGDSCSRACRYCDVPTGNLAPPSKEEPEEVAKTLALLKLQYAVITSVDRDDLEDAGARHWYETIRKVKHLCPDMKVEALIPDFQGNENLIATVCEARPDVLAHNVETVPSLHKRVRPQGRYEWSLKVLELAYKRFNLPVKSSLMLGLGESTDEVKNVMQDLLASGCRLLTLGQYLSPSKKHLPVVEYIHPDQFADYYEFGMSLGFEHIESGPLVRSSYLAERQFSKLKKKLIF